MSDSSFKLRVGNAPCSWGTLEFDGCKGEQITFGRMMDELAETGYTGTELGDWGYMPTDPAALKEELDRRRLVMLGAFVPVALKDRRAHKAGVEKAVKTARLLAAVAGDPAPFLVLADDNGANPERTRNAGRITADLGLSLTEWRIFAQGTNQVASEVLCETGLRTVFHHSLCRIRGDAGRDCVFPGIDRATYGRTCLRYRALCLWSGQLRHSRGAGASSRPRVVRAP